MTAPNSHSASFVPAYSHRTLEQQSNEITSQDIQLLEFIPGATKKTVSRGSGIHNRKQSHQPTSLTPVIQVGLPGYSGLGINGFSKTTQRVSHLGSKNDPSSKLISTAENLPTSTKRQNSPLEEQSPTNLAPRHLQGQNKVNKTFRLPTL